MAFESFVDFLAMGQHGPYVWTAYGLTLAIMVWQVVQPLWRRRRFIAEQQARWRRESSHESGA